MVFFAALPGSRVNAQYIPMVIDSAHWVVLATPLCASAGSVYSVNGDTIVNDTQYYKVYQRTYYKLHCVEYPTPRPTFEPPYRVGPPKIFALMREDTLAEKVWAKMFFDENWQASTVPGNDTLLYHFGLEVGDSLQSFLTPYGPFVVDQIDTVFLFGKLRRRFLDTNYGDAIVEGIGGTVYGPFNLQGLVLNDGEYRLLDYCVGSFQECGLVEEEPSRVEENEVRIISVFPTMATSTIRVSTGNQYPVNRLAIVNTAGHTVYEAANPEPVLGELEIQVDQLPRGFYWITLSLRQGRVGIGKFVKR